MSKNYNKYFNNKEVVEETQATPEVEVDETLIQEDIVETEEPEAVQESEPTPEPVKEEPKKIQILYKINNCKKLNVRSKPNKDGDIVCVLNTSNVFEIEEVESKPEWVKVFTDTGLEGFCMKEYVVVK